MKLKLMIPAGVVLLGALTACAPATADSQAQRPAAEQAADSGAAEAAEKDEKEEPLTGELKQKAEAAALAEFPGKVEKSEHDAERPGLYAVEIELDKGGVVEVYLDKKFKVVGTKDEATDKD